MAHLVLPPVPPVARPRLAPVQQRQGVHVRRRVEEQPDVVVERRLVLLDQQQVVASAASTCRHRARWPTRASPVSTRPGQAMRANRAGATVNAASLCSTPCAIGSWARTMPYS